MQTSKRNRFGENTAKKHKCSDCGQEYTIHDPENPNEIKKDRKVMTFRFPNEWNEQEVLAHKLSHVESPKARRVLGKIVRLPENVREEITDFLDKHYAD